MTKKFFVVTTRSTFLDTFGFHVDEDKIEEFKATIEQKIRRHSPPELDQQFEGETVVQISDPLNQEEYENRYDVLLEDVSSDSDLLLVIDYNDLKEENPEVLVKPVDEP